MSEIRSGIADAPTGELRQVDCVEIYLPKSIAYLSELYRFLREKVTSRFNHPFSLDGFSIYEADGVFRGEVLWEQRTMVIRLLFPRSEAGAAALDVKVSDLGKHIAAIAAEEEQIWICHYPQHLRVFKGRKRLFT